MARRSSRPRTPGPSPTRAQQGRSSTPDPALIEASRETAPETAALAAPHRPDPDDSADVHDPALLAALEDQSSVLVDMRGLYADLQDVLPLDRGPLRPVPFHAAIQPEHAGTPPSEPQLEHRGITRRRRFLQLRREQRLRALAYMLSLEVRRIVEELELRKALLIEVWSKMRARRPLLNLLRSRFERVKPDDLLMLPLDCMSRLDHFFRLLDEFRLYLQVTQDMPTTLELTYEHYRVGLTRVARPLLSLLDGLHHFEGVDVEAPPEDTGPAPEES